jgi:tRNA(adenine34) deaminase
MNDQHWMQRALQLAEKAAALGEVPVGALVVLNDTVVGEGWNQVISSNDPSGHAEIIALRQAAKQLSNYRLADCQLYVTLEPCSMCAGAMVHGRIKRLVFAASEPKAGAVVSQAQLLDAPYMNHQVEYCGGVCSAEASTMLSSFFKQRRAQKKADKKLAR